MTASAEGESSDRLITASGGEAARWVAANLRRTPLLTAATGISTVIGAIGQVVPILLLARIVDGVAARSSPASLLLPLAAVLISVALLGALMAGISNYLIGCLGARLLADLREGVVGSVLRMPTARIENVGRGDVLSRVGDDVSVVSQGISRAIPTVFSASVLVVIAVAGMFGLDYRLGLAGAVALPFYALALRWYLPRSAPLYRRQREAQADRAQAMISGLDAIATVRAYGAEESFRRRVTTHSRRVLELGIETFHLFGRFVGRENRAEFIGLTSIIVAGWWLLRIDAVTLGAVTSAALMFHRLFNPIGAILFTFDEAQKAGSSLTRLVGVLAESDDAQLVQSAAAAGQSPKPQDVEIRHATFCYPGETTPVVRDVNLRIPAGKTLAVVGATGAGKSTLAALVAGIYSPQTGSVHVGAADLSLVDRAQIRQLVSILTQETHVFAGTLANDLRLAAPDATDEELVAAVTKVAGPSWLDRYDGGLATLVGEGGTPLGPADVATLALTTLALSDAPVVVLDESTAESGSQGAATLEASARALYQDRTALLVAHRLTQARTADAIAVMEAGEVVEYGSHDELVDLGGRYARLWRAWEGTSRNLE